MDIKEKISEVLAKEVPNSGATFTEFRGDTVLHVKKEHIVQVCHHLKTNEELRFQLCEDVTAIDWATRKDRFSIVYHIFSLPLSFRLRITTVVDEHDCHVDSVTSVWKTANWHEREVYDMYGISFNNHPDLRRMYMPEEFEYHPLRKEFPLLGIPGSLFLPKK